MEDKILNAIQYSLGRKRQTFGHGFESAYHTVKINGKEFQGQRDITKRYDNIDYDFKDKVVVDFGCNIGGMLHHIADSIDYGVGIDYQPKVINAANMLSSANNHDNVDFYTFNLDNEPIDMLDNFVMGKQIDVCFVLAIALWVNKWKKVVRYCHRVSDTLIYESNGDDNFQKEQYEFLKKLYVDVELLAEHSLDDNRPDSKSKKRTLYICKK